MSSKPTPTPTKPATTALSSNPIFKNVVRYKPDWTKIAESPMAKFFVGVDKVPMEIHAAAVEALSAPLTAMMNNSSIKDPVGAIVFLEDVSVETFRVFIEFAYTGDCCHAFQPQTQTKRKADEVNSSQENTPRKKHQGSLGDNNASVVPATLQSQLLVSTSQKSTPQVLITQSTDFTKFVSSLRDRFKSLNYNPINKPSDRALLSQLTFDVYTFATRFAIEALRQMTVGAFHSSLCSKLDRLSRMHVVWIIENIYSKTLKNESKEQCPMRDLCIRYAVSQADLLHRDVGFEKLLKSNPDFAVDFVRALAE